MWSQRKGGLSAITQVKISSPEIVNIARGQGIHSLEGSIATCVKGECISGNMRLIQRFYLLIERMTLKWLNRRSQCKSFYWKSFIAYLRHYPLPKPRIVHNLHTLSPVV